MLLVAFANVAVFENAPEYDSDVDTLADFVIEPTTIPPNTCLCGRMTRDDDEPLYCSDACARLDALNALTARSRANSLAPTPNNTAPPTPLVPSMHMASHYRVVMRRNHSARPSVDRGDHNGDDNDGDDDHNDGDDDHNGDAPAPAPVDALAIHVHVAVDVVSEPLDADELVRALQGVSRKSSVCFAALPRAKIFSMVLDPALDVASPLKRVETAPELHMRGRPLHSSRPIARLRTSSTPAPPPRRRRHAPTPPVSPADVSSPRPTDPWQTFGAVFDAWGWDTGRARPRWASMSKGLRQSILEEHGHRRQESAESSGSSATDLSWASSSVPPSLDDYPLRPRSPASSSVRTIVPPRASESVLHLSHARKSRRQSSLAALDSILAMEDTFWHDPILVHQPDDPADADGLAAIQFRGDAGGFSFPPKDPVLIAGNLLHPDPHAHRTCASHFPVSPSLGKPSPEIEPQLGASSGPGLFDSPIITTPALSRGSPIPNPSPLSTSFLRTPSSPYLSVPRHAPSLLLRTASAARLAAALNAADDDDEPADSPLVRRSSSLGSAAAMGLGLALGPSCDSRARSSSESCVESTVSRSGSRMNILDPSVLVVPEEDEDAEDYGQLVAPSRFSGLPGFPVSPLEEIGEASPLIDAFPHPMGGYFPGSRFASRANTPVKGLHASTSALSLRQVAMGNSMHQAQTLADTDDEDEEIVTTVQRMRHSMQRQAV
ncbi:Ecl1 domain containing protein [Ceratobasidium theobromae]|uniref:Ecl1 domain containing protein n=1 Tax=Ceratobasidium theobromae TaxID=1582974 RepID=A0A5N5R1D6_9AGAM|nr:Ecl1 domain containing protein [Ceratobasidium theobromae]